MLDSTRLARWIASLAAVFALTLVAAASGSGATNSGCARPLTENSCYRWAHSGETVQARPLSASSCSVPPGGVLTENSCYRFSHRGDPVAAAVPSISQARTSGGLNWTSTGIGAAGAFGLVLLVGGVLLGWRRIVLKPAH